ncbi:MAG: hypothetical protein J3Q66DRAFT_439614 [Benniella sp.]|nr:MAG: hypothetical protein J3Q66DRAFT_439614 [Benniella sp.]
MVHDEHASSADHPIQLEWTLSVTPLSRDQTVTGDARHFSPSSGGSLSPPERRSKPPHGLRIDSRSASGVSISSHKSQQSAKGGLGPKLVNWWKSVRRKSISLVQPRKAVDPFSTTGESGKHKDRSQKKRKGHKGGQEDPPNIPPLPTKEPPLPTSTLEKSDANSGPLVLTTALNQTESTESTSPTKSPGTKTSPREKPGLSIKVNMSPPLVRRSSVMARTSSFSAGISNGPEGSPQQPGMERSNKTIRSMLEQCKADCDEEMRKIIDGLNEFVEKGLNYADGLEYRHGKDCQLDFERTTARSPRDPEELQHLVEQYANAFMDSWSSARFLDCGSDRGPISNCELASESEGGHSLEDCR